MQRNNFANAILFYGFLILLWIISYLAFIASELQGDADGSIVVTLIFGFGVFVMSMISGASIVAYIYAKDEDFAEESKR